MLTLLLLGTAGCGFADTTPTADPTIPPSPHIAVSPSPSAAPSTAVYSLPTQGLNLHSAPSRDAPTATTVRQGVQLDVLAAQVVGAESWLHVRAHDKPEVDGWALKDPGLETGTPVDLHTDAVLSYSILFPKGWTFREDSPVQQSFASPTADGRLVIQVAATVEALPALPSSPGQTERQEGPVEVYGKSPLITFYKLTGGGYELAVHFLFAAGRAFQIILRTPAGDSTLFKQLLASAVIQ